MNYKRNVLVLSAVAAFLVLTFVVGIIIKNLQSGPEPSYDFVIGLTKDNLASIKVTHGNDTVELSKKNGNWLVGFAGGLIKAKATRIDALVTSILSLKSNRRVSTTASSHEELKLTDALAYKLELSDDKGAIKHTVLLGDTSTQGTDQFVREAGNDTAYTTAAGLAFNVEQKATYWVDKQAWPESVASGKALSISYSSKDTGAFILTKTTKDNVDTWTNSAKPNLDQGAVSSWVRGITSLEGDDIIALDQGKMPAGYTNENISVSIKDATTETALEAFKPTAANAPWIVVSKNHGFKTESGQEYALLVADWKVKADIFKK